MVVTSRGRSIPGKALVSTVDSLYESPESSSVSVVVLTHSRRELVERALTSVMKQDIENLEVIVVDNASTDGTADLIRERFPSARLLILAENMGIRGRNEGFKTASGDVIVSLDDDIELVDPNTLRRIRKSFTGSSVLGALSLRICDDPETGECAAAHWWHPVPREKFQDRQFETDHINEAAVAFRRIALEKVGGYYEALFWGGEEWDLCLGLMDAGYEIRYLPETVWHLAPRGSLDGRPDPRHVLLIRNRCWIAVRRLPLFSALAFVLPRLALWAVRSIRYGYFRLYLHGLWETAQILPRAFQERKLVSRTTRKRLRRLRTQHDSR